MRPAERESLAFAGAWEELDESISTARLPASALVEPIVTAKTLENHIDLGIDTNRRVIEDPGSGHPVMSDERFTHKYDPPERAEVGPAVGGPGAVLARYLTNGSAPGRTVDYELSVDNRP